MAAANMKVVCWNTQKNDTSVAVVNAILKDSSVGVLIVIEPAKGGFGPISIMGEDDPTPPPSSRRPVIGRRIDGAGMGMAQENVIVLWKNDTFDVTSVKKLNDYMRQNVANRVPITVSIANRTVAQQNTMTGWHAPTNGDGIYSIIAKYVQLSTSFNVQAILGDFNTDREDGYNPFELASASGAPTMLAPNGSWRNPYDKVIANSGFFSKPWTAGRYYGDGKYANDYLTILSNFRSYSDHVPVYIDM